MAFADDAQKWAAVSTRDPAADGAFVYCVKTTKIFCRPTCKARLARRSNVEFFVAATEAERAGYRACKRCRPELAQFTPQADKIEEVCAMLRRRPKDAPLPQLERMARCAGLTKHHFHRLFKRETGLTPRQYVLANRRARREDEHASQTESVAIENEGNSTSSGAVLCPWDIDTPISNLTVDVGSVDGDAPTSVGPSEWNLSSEDLAMLEECLLDHTLVAGDSNTPIVEPEPLYPALGHVRVHYTTIQTTRGILLIAFQGEKICKLDLGTSYAEVLGDLEKTHPMPMYFHVPLEELSSNEYAARQAQIETVVEALERPCGRLVHL